MTRAVGRNINLLFIELLFYFIQQLESNVFAKLHSLSMFNYLIASKAAPYIKFNFLIFLIKSSFLSLIVVAVFVCLDFGENFKATD